MKQKMKNKNLLRIGAVLSLIAAWVAIPFAIGSANDDMSRDTRIEASLTGPAINGTTPAGFSEYRIDDRGRIVYGNGEYGALR